MTTIPTNGAEDLASRLRNACASVRSKSYPLADLIPLMQQAADALASTPAQPEVPAGCVAMPRAAISRAIEVLDWLPTSDSMQPLWAKQQAALDELRLSLAAAPAQPVAEQANADSVQEDACHAPPLGWRCTRKAGHEGPCAAVEYEDDKQFVERGMQRIRDAEDAARYRLLRRGQHWSVIDGGGNELLNEALDHEVDAARKQGVSHDR